MAWWHPILNNNFLIKLRNWEYWPFGIVQFPLFFYYPWLSLRAGSFTFFSGSNPGILMGGMFGESKYAVLELIPPDLKPKSALVHGNVQVPEVAHIIQQNSLRYPLIFKPDIGERGFMVKRINDEGDIAGYLEKMKHAFIIQELVDLPLEFGVFYERRPSSSTGKITSIVMKEMLTVDGDGVSTLQQLILQKERARLQWPQLREKYSHKLNHVLPQGETIEIVSIGNHCLGTKFLNGNHLITERLSANFDRIAQAIPGFYFGRFDLRCKSLDDLQIAKVTILELNGCGAEPAHIYDPNFSFWKAVGVLIRHWTSIYDISSENKRLGFKYLSLKEAIQHYNNFKDKTR